ncbi:MAG: hypothetical protein KA314_18585 [Chloroflexi bacterium]|nr:hypothetical protein [Chloroflexota bacterium]MBP8057840.1 hypothetical protein [Chloroflexota bacterium]
MEARTIVMLGERLTLVSGCLTPVYPTTPCLTTGARQVGEGIMVKRRGQPHLPRPYDKVRVGQT